MAAVRLLDRVDGEEADGVDDLLLQLGSHQGLGVWALRAASSAAPSSPASVSSTTCTGICSRRTRMRPLSKNESRKRPSFNESMIRGAIPPATKTPPVDNVFKAKLPVSAPYNLQKSSSACLQSGSPAFAAALTAAGAF